MSYRAVLFDLDGTLLDTIADLAASMNAALERFGFPPHGVESYKLFVGDGIEALVRRSLPEEHADERRVGELAAAMREEYGRRWKDATRPYDGVPEMLDGLTARGVPMAVLSNKPDDFTRMCVASLLPRWRFEHVMGARAGLPKKPDPAGAIETASRLGVEPAEVLYLGDSGTDMKTAVAAGMFAVGALWGFRARKELLGGGAKALLAGPREVLALFT